MPGALLRAHVEGRAHVGERQAVHSQLLAQAKVGELKGAKAVEEDVGGLDVAVHDLEHVVKVADGVGQVLKPLLHLSCGEALLGERVLLDDLVQSVDAQLHEDVHAAVVDPRAAQVDDVGVVARLLHELHLLQHALLGLGVRVANVHLLQAEHGAVALLHGGGGAEGASAHDLDDDESLALVGDHGARHVCVCVVGGYPVWYPVWYRNVTHSHWVTDTHPIVHALSGYETRYETDYATSFSPMPRTALATNLLSSLGDDVLHCILRLLPEGTEFVVRIVCSRWASLLSPDGTVSFLSQFATAVPLLQWAKSNGCSWNETAYIAAGKGGSVPVLRWLRVHGPEGGQTTERRCMIAAAFGGHLDALQWLISDERRPDLLRVCSWEAAKGGHLHVLEWLFSTDSCEPDTGTLYCAVKGGNLAVLQWLHAHGSRMDGHECFYAAKYGHLDVLKWVHSKGCGLDSQVFTAAAQQGHVEMLEWLHQKQCPWDERVAAGAAGEGHLVALQWLHETGCPWGEETSEAAMEKGHLETMAWLSSAGCPIGDLTMMKWMAECLPY